MQAENVAHSATTPRATMTTPHLQGPKMSTALETAQEHMDSEELHSLLDAAMATAA
ncbi:Hypothetical predicted protein, partial [Pelobates cultripes]